jgi:hypothetical protein
MVSSTDLVLRVIALFDELAIPYMLVGSYSSNYYGRPRSTKDADFVVIISDDQMRKLQSGLGSEFHVDSQMSFETVTMTTRHLIVHTASAFKIELFLLTDDAHDQERFKRRRQVDFEGRLTWLPTAEDVIVQKLLWSKLSRRGKDIEDAQRVLSLQQGKLDMAYIRHWCGLRGTQEHLEKILLAISSDAGSD